MSKTSRLDALEIARMAAGFAAEEHSYIDGDNIDDFEPHEWVLNAVEAALNTETIDLRVTKSKMESWRTAVVEAAQSGFINFDAMPESLKNKINAIQNGVTAL